MGIFCSTNPEPTGEYPLLVAFYDMQQDTVGQFYNPEPTGGPYFLDDYIFLWLGVNIFCLN